MNKKLLSALLISTVAIAASAEMNDVGPQLRYATDAFPGFEIDEQALVTTKKTPGWFSWFTGPKMDTSAEQFEWASECATNGSLSKAASAYDALVRKWPNAPEAAKAQRALADLRFQEGDYPEAFNEYRYLVDFYTIACNYDEVSKLMYETAGRMRTEGKSVFCIRFDNIRETRRAYEMIVLRAPGAAYAPAAMMAAGQLRREAGEFDLAVQIFENVRNRYPESDESLAAVREEAEVRRELLAKHGYNRARVNDAIAFLKRALENRRLDAETEAKLKLYLEEASLLRENEAFEAARFYDTKTRTRTSAIGAYNRFLEQYPIGANADLARQRIAELTSSINNGEIKK